MNPIKIGTRESALALWQAHKVRDSLHEQGCSTRIVPIKSSGDIFLEKPLYEMGITGIFTKALDTALLNKQIDIAVHSMKDVPTRLPRGLIQLAVLERGVTQDILVTNLDTETSLNPIIATGSLRRQAQWLSKYPHHRVENLRGNLKLRLEKLKSNPHWYGAIFAKAGLERLGLTENAEELEWMIPAPAQGAIMVICRHEDLVNFKDKFLKINHLDTEMCVKIERDFLQTLEGGCTAPIGAIARISRDKIHFRGILLTKDGNQKLQIEEETSFEARDMGHKWAKILYEKGGREILKSFRSA